MSDQTEIPFKQSKLPAAILSVLAATMAPGAQAEIEEIVVTATKRAESTQDIPVSVQAVTGDNLRELGADNFDEYVNYLSNVIFTGRGPGQREMYIRGVSTEQSAITVTSTQGMSPAVALYADEQPVSLVGRNLDIYATDLQRIEVLPGPQGTLFGASSQTGTVRLITNKPDHDAFDASLDATQGFTTDGAPSTNVEAMINLPLTDSLAVRAALYTDSAGGWIDNIPGTYSSNIEVINRNQISSAAHVCTGDAAVDGPISGDACGGQRASVAAADNSELVKEDFNDATYRGARFGLSWNFSEDWNAVVQHTVQTLETEGVFEFDPNLGDEGAVQRFAPTQNQDEFGLTTWTLSGRLQMLQAVYTGGYLDRDVYFTQDYTGYTNGGGYQAYYICTGGYSNATQCFDPAKQFTNQDTTRRFTNEFRVSTDWERRWNITAGIFVDSQENTTNGEFQYFGAVEAGFNVSAAPGTVTDPAGTPPVPGNIVSTVDGVTSPYGRGPTTIFVNNFTRNQDQIALFGEFSVDLTDRIGFTFGARNYDIDLEFIGSTGSSFGCKGSETVCDGQGFDNVVTRRLEVLGDFSASGDIADLEGFFGGTSQVVADAAASGSLYLEGLGRDGIINQNDTIYRATLNWFPVEDLQLFGTWSEGFRPPTANRHAARPSGNQTGAYEGYLIPAIARTDHLTNFEIGMKGEFLDHTLRLNATAYVSEIDNLQISRFDPANVGILVFIENAGDAEVNGLDLDFTWAPMPDLTISGAASFVDNKLTRINPQLEAVIAPVGSRLPHTPEFRGNVRARYDFHLDGWNADAYVRGGLTFTGDSLAQSACNAYFVEDVTRLVYGRGSGLDIVEEGGFCGVPLTGGDLAAVTDPSFIAVDADGDTRFKAARYKQEAYTLANIAAGVGRDGWTAEFFIDNLFDKRAHLFVHAADYTPRVSTNRPRTYGLRFSYDLR